jgi:hypothetical protein
MDPLEPSSEDLRSSPQEHLRHALMSVDAARRLILAALNKLEAEEAKKHG